MGGMDDPAAFLAARLDEIERAAPAVHAFAALESWIGGCACGWPELLARDIAAKRAILARYEALRNPKTLRDRLMFPSLAVMALRDISDLAAAYDEPALFDPGTEQEPQFSR